MKHCLLSNEVDASSLATSGEGFIIAYNTMKFKTKLWKRSNKSFATTIPHIALLTMDESKDYDVVWEFNEKIQKWTVSLKETKKARSSSKKGVKLEDDKTK